MYDVKRLFACAVGIADLAQQVEALNFLVLLLPDVNRNCLQVTVLLLISLFSGSTPGVYMYVCVCVCICMYVCM